jgi:hypothetical protein
MLDVLTEDTRIRIGRHFAVDFQRTLRIPDDGHEYPLPPGLGAFPIYRVEEYADRLPASWLQEHSVSLPMYQREALGQLEGADWRPNAVTVGIGRINAITGRRLHGRLNKTRQNYLVCPDQPWLDGINAGTGFVRQFVAMPLGSGYTVEGQMTGMEKFGGIQITAYDPKPGIFPDTEPSRHDSDFAVYVCAPEMGMGLGAGGRMRQEIYPDEYGVDTWDPEEYGRVHVHIVDSMLFRETAGLEPTSTPVTARIYTERGLPWFDLYDEERGDLQPDLLDRIKSVKQIDTRKKLGGQQDDSSSM